MTDTTSITQAEVRINKVGVSHAANWSVQVMLPGLHAIVEAPSWGEAWKVAQHYTEPLMGRSLPFGGREPARVLRQLDATGETVKS